MASYVKENTISCLSDILTSIVLDIFDQGANCIRVCCRISERNAFETAGQRICHSRKMGTRTYHSWCGRSGWNCALVCSVRVEQLRVAAIETIA